ncbi:uncharacterized protein LOC130655476 [Hydractinia symbiolongicarpus]|uniref:uncharacterized protein LOC130655476 n=1 Tax=Hydractinia symbiolongicarpus TaxID=13093 RepID=UPI00254C9318|nr:uncharacterized protein LOC130655476 [Hydractinia symbiolongicarpus]
MTETNFENLEFHPFQTNETLLLNDENDPDLNFYNCTLSKNTNTKYYSPNSDNIFAHAKNYSFSILHLNIRSMQKNFESFKQFLHTLNFRFKIICLTETWCRDEAIKNNSNFQLCNYSVIHQIRNSNKAGGGVCVFIHNSLLYKKRTELCVNNNDCESLSVEILNKTTTNIIVSVIYRQPAGSIDNFKTLIEPIILINKNTSKAVYLVGDLNLNTLDYETNRNIQCFFNFIFQSGYIPLINKPTRVTKQNATVIDHIITNSFCDKELHSGIIKTDISDHFPIFITSNTNFDKQSNHYLLAKVKWDDVVKGEDANDAYDSFLKIFLEAYDAAFPEEIKKTWNIIKEVIGKIKIRSNNFPSKLVNDENEIEEPSLIAEEFNNFFTKVGPTLASKIGHSTKSFKSYLSYYDNEIEKKELSEEELEAAFHSLQINKSPGFDQISSNVLKNCFNELKSPLLHIFNSSLITGIVPKKLKIARVVPVLKAGEVCKVSNYRPISILPCFSKILERIMYNRVYSFLNNNDILYNKQFGFQAGHSTDHAIIQLSQEIFQAFDENKFTIGVFIDLSKAFDTVNHEILLEKLKNYGIRNTYLAWFNNYLFERKQYISYDEGNTNYRIITCGVPQGSILGPLLFLIYINDIFRASSVLNSILFADDTNLFFTHKDINVLFETTNLELAKLADWFKANKLSLNTSKTRYTFFHKLSKKDKIPLRLPGLVIDHVNIRREYSMKFLGVLLDENLTWREHIKLVENKVSKSLGILYKASFALNKNCLRSIYFSFIHCYLNYANIAWGSTNITKLKKLHIQQKHASRIILRQNKCSHSRPLLKELGILNVCQLNIFQVLIFMYKIKNLIAPNIFITLFKKVQHKYPTRFSGNNFLRPKIISNVTKFSISNRGPKLWSMLLNDEIKSIPSTKQFKIALRNQLLRSNNEQVFF